MNGVFWRVAAVFGLIGVALGAFGAHGLEDRVTEEALGWWKTGAHYQMLHALAIGLVAAHPRRPVVAGIAFAVGICVFSGSLYLMTFTGIRWLGAITPLGGLSFLIGWLTLALTAPRAHPSV